MAALPMPTFDVRLRPVTPADLPFLFEMQQDPEGNRMSMTRPRTREQFDAVWEKSWSDTRVVPRAILLGRDDGLYELVGSIGCFAMDGLDSVGYAVARPYWGRGIATRALTLLIGEVPTRPLHARAASSNTGSCTVLLRCGFVRTETRLSPASPDGRYLACEESSFVLE